MVFYSTNISGSEIIKHLLEEKEGFKFDIKICYHPGRYEWELLNENRIALPAVISAIHVSRVFIVLKKSNRQKSCDVIGAQDFADLKGSLQIKVCGKK